MADKCEKQTVRSTCLTERIIGKRGWSAIESIAQNLGRVVPAGDSLEGNSVDLRPADVVEQ